MAYSYTTVPGKLPALLQKIRETGVPAKATQNWLASLGYKSKNDRTLLTVMKQIRFVDATGAPTDYWKQFRGANSAQVLARALREGYADLFEMYADAPSRSQTELEDFFSTRTSAGRQAISKMIMTFKNVASGADFAGAAAASPDEVLATLNGGAGAKPPVIARNVSAGVTININVQLTLPETTDEQVYNQFFAAMKKYLMGEDES